MTETRAPYQATPPAKSRPNYKRDAKRARPADVYTPQGYDACQTPPAALDPLWPHLRQFNFIWEPAAGEGLLAEALRKRFGVVASDILTGHNFFTWQPPAWECLVTNPPYSLKYPWLRRCYELSRPFALLVPVETLGAQSAHRLFARYGVEVIFMTKRVNFKMPNKGWAGKGAQFPVCWVTHGLGIGRQMSYWGLDDGEQ
jgi:hypothetical protein